MRISKPCKVFRAPDEVQKVWATVIYRLYNADPKKKPNLFEVECIVQRVASEWELSDEWASCIAIEDDAWIIDENKWREINAAAERVKEGAEQ